MLFGKPRRAIAPVSVEGRGPRSGDRTGPDGLHVVPVAGDSPLANVQRSLESVLFGKPGVIRHLLVALLAGGHVLLEDVPGVGKTTLAKGLARVLEGQFHRVQFTPDLLPGDILGVSVYSPTDGQFRFKPGPVFANVLLADEINRASPRTQSSLLEAMNEGQATIDGVTWPLPRPFLVLATQNPVEHHGTYPLPEAQLDRFLFQLDLGYPDSEVELAILYSQSEGHPLEHLDPCITPDEVLALQAAVRRVKVDEKVGRYIVALAAATRRHPAVQVGVSPRGSLSLFRASQGLAFLAGRSYVLPDDVKALAPACLAHRLVLELKARYGGHSKLQVLDEVLASVPVPT